MLFVDLSRAQLGTIPCSGQKTRLLPQKELPALTDNQTIFTTKSNFFSKFKYLFIEVFTSQLCSFICSSPAAGKKRDIISQL